MNWEKITRYRTVVKVGRRSYRVLCESDLDGGFAVYINNSFVTDVECLPDEEELHNIISDNIEIEESIKGGYAASGVFI